jgi:hypothetical protein
MTLTDLESQLLALTPSEKQYIIQLLSQSLAIPPAETAPTPPISSGSTKIANTQIAVWELVNDLATAWAYADAHYDEISLILQEIDE